MSPQGINWNKSLSYQQQQQQQPRLNTKLNKERVLTLPNIVTYPKKNSKHLLTNTHEN